MTCDRGVLAVRRGKTRKGELKEGPVDVPSWRSGNKSDWEPGGCGFDLWPPSVGSGSRVAVLLWLWCRPVATAPIRPLAWEPPYAESAALEKTKTKKKKIHLSVKLEGGPEQCG